MTIKIEAKKTIAKIQFHHHHHYYFSTIQLSFLRNTKPFLMNFPKVLKAQKKKKDVESNGVESHSVLILSKGNFVHGDEKPTQLIRNESHSQCDIIGN
ncbi:CLUMA_CG001672, isoform A [Clunio marinus]|uniref:CLUMA_CG001672, isoform A n=1 Tax=Clunio marinus TaxID=568069 RepID=A0A1J1HIP8_9DIPT|nr:CLUMA_CG001672, isoform A [Clunio marinus]